MKEANLTQSPTDLLFQLVKTANNPIEIERLISEHNADYDAVDSDGNTPLRLAVMNGFAENVKILLEYSSSNINGNHLLHIACELGNLEIVELLLAQGADIEEKETMEELTYTPLHVACDEGHVQVVELLLQKGADIEASIGDARGKISLDLACQEGHVQVVELLLKTGFFEPDNLYIGTSFHLACRHGHKEVIEVLLKHGVDVDVMEEGGDCDTPLYVAYNNDDVETAELLLKNGANPNCLDLQKSDGVYYGTNPLHSACESGDLKFVELLIKYGADIDFPKWGTELRPLNLACDNNQDEIVRLLIKKGANINIINEDYTQLWGSYKNRYFNSKFLWPIFKEAINKDDTEVLKNLYKYEYYRNIFYSLHNNELKRISDELNKVKLASGSKIDLRTMVDSSDLVRYNLMKFNTIISTSGRDSKSISKMLDFLTGSKRGMLQEKVFGDPNISTLIMSFVTFHIQWSGVSGLKKHLQNAPIYKSVKDIIGIVKSRGIEVKVVSGADLGVLQKAFKFSEEDKQTILAKFSSALAEAFNNYPQASKLFAKNHNKATQFIWLKLIAKTLSYKIDYYSEADSIIHFSGGANPVAKFKIYETSQGKQLISRQALVAEATGIISVEAIDNTIVSSLDNQYSKKRVLEDAEQDLVVKIARAGEASDVMEVEAKTERPLEVVQGQGYSIFVSLGHSSAGNSFVQNHHNLKHVSPYLKILEVMMPKITIQGAVQESKPEILKIKLAQDSKYEQVNEAVSYSEIFYKATIGLKVADIGLDAFKVVYEPTFDNLNLLVQDAAHLGVMLTGTSGYLPLVSAVDIAVQAYNGEYSKAMSQAGAIIGYMLLPTMLGTSLAPVYTASVLAYTGYKVVSAAYSEYSNYDTAESQLKSYLAYGLLYKDLGLYDKAKKHLFDADMIVAQNKDSSSIQDIAAEYNLLGKICELEPSHDYCQ
ncbi:MAG: ankyrin repeat domain-containing protein [Rickettsiales bacterium]